MEITVTKGKQKVPVRTLIYGVHGIGKSTLTSQFPKPIFIDLEGGTTQLDVARLPQPEKLEDFLAELAWVKDHSNEYQTLVIDTLDRVEDLVRDYVCRMEGKASIEDFGYGKGWKQLTEKMVKIRDELDKVCAKGMHVVAISHSKVAKRETPEGEQYDTWDVCLYKDVVPGFTNWADILCFMNYKVQTIKAGEGFKEHNLAISSERYMYFEKAPTFEAKNRYGLPSSCMLSYEPFKPIFDGIVEKKPQATEIPLDSTHEGIVDDSNPITETPQNVFTSRLEAQGITVEQYNAWSSSRGTCTLENDSDGHIQSMLDNFDLLVEAIKG